MEMSFAKWPSALKMRLRLASACPSPFAYASLQPEQTYGSGCAVRELLLVVYRLLARAALRAHRLKRGLIRRARTPDFNAPRDARHVGRHAAKIPTKTNLRA